MSGKMDKDLDRLLAEMVAETAPPAGLDGLMARILADAAREQPAPARPAPPRPVAEGPARGAGGRVVAGGGGWLDALAGVFGGRGALAGLTLATLSGLWLGIAQPAALTGLTSLTGLGGETPLASIDLLSGSDSLWTEATP